MILITHYMEEVIDADQVFVMDEGHVVMQDVYKRQGGSSALCISWKNIAKEENEHDQWNRSSG